MKKVIITGANGFIGSNLVKELLGKNISVTSVVRSKDSDISSLPQCDRNKIVFCDMSEIQKLPSLISDRDFDVFYHFAWEGSSGSARTDDVLQMKNALWTAEAVRISKALSCKRFVGAGSIMEKETIAAIYSEGNKPGLGYIYGTGKLTAHCISKSVAANLGVEHIWGLITNAYGVGEVSPRFINTTIRKIINSEPLKFTSATQNYDFIYITDVAKAFYCIGHYGKPFKSYIIGSSNAKPLKEFIFEIWEGLANGATLNFGDVPFTGVSIPLVDFDTESLKSDTGFHADVSFSDGIQRTMSWLKERSD